MKQNYLRHIIPLLSIILLIGIGSCSTQKNTAKSRWWHSFNARYNTYYNGTLAYIDGSLEKENGNKDNFTEMIPLYTVSNKTAANWEKAIMRKPSPSVRKRFINTVSRNVRNGTKTVAKQKKILNG